MNYLQNLRVKNVTPAAAIVDNAAVTTATIDTRGFTKLLIVVCLGALDIAIAAMKLQESAASNMAGATDVRGADFSVAPLTLPTATDDNKVYGIHVDLRGRKRYLDLSLTAGDGAAGTYVSVIAILDGASEHPNSAFERGFAQEAFV